LINKIIIIIILLGGMSEENAERLAEALCRMRGAALKLGKEKEMKSC